MSVKLGTALPAQIAVFDTETDGVDTETCHIVTAFIGVMDVASGNMVERRSWLLNTGHPIPKEASDVHGITTERMQAEGMDPKQGVFEIVQYIDILQKRGLATVVMNAPFDYTLLDRETLRHWPDMRPIVPERVFDPMVLDRAFDKYRAGSRKLVDLAKVYGVPVETNAHDAEADCRMAGRIAIKLMGHSRLQDMTLEEIHNKQIPTHRASALSLAEYWSNGKGLVGKSLEEKREAIREVRAHAGHWPMRPRPTETEGVTQ